MFGFKLFGLIYFRYRRKGNSCLGLNPKRHFITWVDSASEKKKIEKKQDRYFSKAGRLLLSIEGFPVHPGDVGPGAKQTPVTSDFMAVSDWKEEDVRGPAAPAWVNPLGVYDASTTLWLQGKGQPEPENQQARPAGAPGNVNTAMISKVEEFNRKLRENPEDAKTWMEFVNFQVQSHERNRFYLFITYKRAFFKPAGTPVTEITVSFFVVFGQKDKLLHT